MSSRRAFMTTSSGRGRPQPSSRDPSSPPTAESSRSRPTSSLGRRSRSRSSPPPDDLQTSDLDSRGDNDSELSELASCQRRLDRALQTIEEYEGGPKKKQSSSTSLGRGIRKLIDLYLDVLDLVTYYDEWKAHLTGAATLEDDDDYRKKCKRAYQSVLLLDKLIQNFFQKIDNAGPEEVNTWYAQLQRGGNNSRSEDVHNLVPKIAEWLNGASMPANPPLSPEDRSNRGVDHDLCGRMLSSIAYDWDDPSVRAKIRAGAAGYALTDCPRALYAGYDGDVGDLQAGFLQSMLLIKTFKFLFTSPSSAKEINIYASEPAEPDSAPPRKRRCSKKARGSSKTVAGLLHMRSKVTPRAIAYAATQLLFALSSAPMWCDDHEGFDFKATYYYIVDFFDVDPRLKKTKARVDELLRWWNEQIFPGAADETAKDGPSLADRLSAQREALEED